MHDSPYWGIDLSLQKCMDIQILDWLRYKELPCKEYMKINCIKLISLLKRVRARWRSRSQYSDRQQLARIGQQMGVTPFSALLPLPLHEGWLSSGFWWTINKYTSGKKKRVHLFCQDPAVDYYFGHNYYNWT